VTVPVTVARRDYCWSAVVTQTEPPRPSAPFALNCTPSYKDHRHSFSFSRPLMSGAFRASFRFFFVGIRIHSAYLSLGGEFVLFVKILYPPLLARDRSLMVTFKPTLYRVPVGKSDKTSFPVTSLVAASFSLFLSVARSSLVRWFSPVFSVSVVFLLGGFSSSPLEKSEPSPRARRLLYLLGGLFFDSSFQHPNVRWVSKLGFW